MHAARSATAADERCKCRDRPPPACLGALLAANLVFSSRLRATGYATLKVV